MVLFDWVNRWQLMKALLISVAEGTVMKFQLQRVGITAWMRTQSGGITTWTSPVLKTTPPDLKARFCCSFELLNLCLKNL